MSQSPPAPDAPPRRKPIPGYIAVSHPAGAAGWGAALFSLPFLAVGMGIMLVAARIVPVNPSSVRAPMWVLGVFGAIFFLAGLFVLIIALRGLSRMHRLKADALRHPLEPWLADYPWDRQRIRSRGTGKALAALVGGAFMILFLCPFNYFGFVERVWPVLIFVVIFDLLALIVLGNGVYLLVRQLKYGRSELRFERFPFLLGDTLEVGFTNERGIGAYRSITFTLRCVEEEHATTGTGKNKRTTTLGYELWSDQFVVEQAGELRGGEAPVPVTFLLPDRQELGTALNRVAPRYWELLVHADTPGVDYEASFLVPVYARRQ